MIDVSGDVKGRGDIDEPCGVWGGAANVEFKVRAGGGGGEAVVAVVAAVPVPVAVPVAAVRPTWPTVGADEAASVFAIERRSHTRTGMACGRYRSYNRNNDSKMGNESVGAKVSDDEADTAAMAPVALVPRWISSLN